MSDYSKSVIYMLKRKDDDDNENVYVGSTTDITRRKGSHKNTCNNPNDRYHNNKKYQYIRENGGWDEWIMVVIENYPCNSDEELKLREDEIMCEMNSKLNEKRVRRSSKQYRIDNHDIIMEKAKYYREVNREPLTEYMREYRENNKEKIAEKNKDYYQDNHDKLLEYYNERVKCNICGCESARGNLSRHQKTLKCIEKAKKREEETL